MSTHTDNNETASAAPTTPAGCGDATGPCNMVRCPCATFEGNITKPCANYACQHAYDDHAKAAPQPSPQPSPSPSPRPSPQPSPHPSPSPSPHPSPSPSPHPSPKPSPSPSPKAPAKPLPWTWLDVTLGRRVVW
ncbi:hypothetical protein C8J57DRAFT_1215532 [Mycena rebaudengoi]|nr:hypothetical protein C8J57DRAFT_1215532 [Mycena rebaudengoi]